jgi:MFS family permease
MISETGTTSAAAPRRSLAGLLMAASALGGFGAILPVFRDSLQAHFALNNAQFALLLTFGSLAGAAGALASGPLTDRRGAWPAFRIFLSILAAGCALGAVAAGWLWLLGSLAIVYFGFYALLIPAQAGLVALFPGNRRRILSVFLVASALFSMVMPLIGEALLKLSAAGWMTFGTALHGLFGVMALVMLAILALFRRQAGSAPPAAVAAEAHTGVVGGLWLLVALAALHGTFDAMSATWIPRILAGPSYAAWPFLPGTVVAFFGLSYVVSRALLGLLPEHKWRRRLMVAPGLMGGLVLAAGLLTRTQAGAAVGYVAAAFCWSVEYPMFLSAMSGDRRFGKAMAALNVSCGVLCFLLPTAQGMVIDRLHEAGFAGREWMVLLAPAAGFILVGLLGAVWVRRYGKNLR